MTVVRLVDPFDLDGLLENMKGHEYQMFLALIINEDGKFEWFGNNLTAQEANFFMDRAKAWLLKDDTI